MMIGSSRVRASDAQLARQLRAPDAREASSRAAQVRQLIASGCGACLGLARVGHLVTRRDEVDAHQLLVPARPRIGARGKPSPARAGPPTARPPQPPSAVRTGAVADVRAFDDVDDIFRNVLRMIPDALDRLGDPDDVSGGNRARVLHHEGDQHRGTRAGVESRRFRVTLPTSIAWPPRT